MYLLEGFENRNVSIVRVTNLPDSYGGISQTLTTVISNLLCRIDSNSGRESRLLQGSQASADHTLFCNSSADIRVRDRVTNIRNSETGEVEKTDLNGVLVAVEYDITWVSNPGSEGDHFECSLKR